MSAGGNRVRRAVPSDANTFKAAIGPVAYIAGPLPEAGI
jgi:hypothetical protein